MTFLPAKIHQSSTGFLSQGSMELDANNGHDHHSPGVSNERTGGSRHPRWSRQETLALIQGKRAAENRMGKGCRSGGSPASEQIESKWDSVATYCRTSGVNRGPVQCRKRWGNLLASFRKIRAWESGKKEETESFWLMGNDSRKERKLPSSFDRKVYDVLEESETSPPGSRLSLIKSCMEDPETLERNEIVLVKQEVAEAIFDSSRPASTEDGLFSDFEQSGHEDIERSPEKGTVLISESPIRTVPAPAPVSADTDAEKQSNPNPSRISTTPDQLKRRRLSSDGCCRNDTEDRLIKVLEKNGELLNKQLEHINFNCQVDRDRRDEQTNNLVAAVSKLTDAVLRIADKL